MLRKTMFALAMLALLGLAAAQIAIAPTGSSGYDQIAKGATTASVDQTVELKLPQATALHLAANTITFDLAYLDGDDWDERAFLGELSTLPDDAYACVYVSGDDVVSSNLGDTFWGQTQIVPGGIAYAATTWPGVKLVYFGNGKSGNVPDSARVVTYPPIRIDPETGMLVEGSKGYFVCYQTFVIQLFSNFNFFDLQVARLDETGQGIQHLYVQGNACADFGDPTGLYDLPNGAMRHLLPKTLNYGPTGTRVCDVNSSWTDVLGVLAVKVNSDLWGNNVANLTYTLVSSDTQF